MTAKPNDANLEGKNALANSVAELNGPLENLKLEIPSLISNIVQFTLESQKIGATEPEKLEMTAKFEDHQDRTGRDPGRWGKEVQGRCGWLTKFKDEIKDLRVETDARLKLSFLLSLNENILVHVNADLKQLC